MVRGGGYCEGHGQREARRYDDARGNSGARGYDRQWRKMREHILAREPLCRDCRRRGYVVAATVVDHVEPKARHERELDPNNLQPLCHACHNRKTRREAKQ